MFSFIAAVVNKIYYNIIIITVHLTSTSSICNYKQFIVCTLSKFQVDLLNQFLF